MVIGAYIMIITIKVNGLNAPAKRHRLAEWIQKQDPYRINQRRNMPRHIVIKLAKRK